MVKIITSSSILLILSFLAPSSWANEWRFEVAPYYWAAKQKGDVAQNNSFLVAGETEPRDVAGELDSGTESVGLIALSAAKGNWLLWTEAYSVDSDNREVGALWNTDVSAEQTSWDLDVGYRFLHDDELDLYVYGGLRLAEVDGDIRGTLIDTGEVKSIDIGDDWVDPIIGIHSRWQLSEKWAYWASLESAGFGVGSESSWQMMLAIDQKLTKNISLRYAYRFVGIDYDDNDFVYDVGVNGLLIGAGFGF